MDIARNSPDSTLADAPHRILVAVHGHEPAGWESQVCLAAASWPFASLRVLAVVDAPTSAFSSVIPLARRTHAAAARTWRRLAEERVGRRLETLLKMLSPETGVTCIGARQADPGSTIASQAEDWDADLVILGPDERPGLQRWLLGAIHERVVVHARCGVLIIPATKTAKRAGPGRATASAGSAPFGESQPLAAHGEV